MLNMLIKRIVSYTTVNDLPHICNFTVRYCQIYVFLQVLWTMNYHIIYSNKTVEMTFPEVPVLHVTYDYIF